MVFLSVGFETTTPAGCLSVKKAGEDRLSNYSLLVANKTMPQAYQALKGSADVFLYPGHVNAITGTALCEHLAEEGISGVVAGFTAKELLTALAVALVRFQEGKPFFVNCYPRVVKSEGSPEAQKLIGELMEPCDSEWRGLGVIPGSGWCSGRSGKPLMPEKNMQCRRSRAGQIQPVVAGMCFRENANHQIVRYSERSVPRSIR